MTTKTLPKHRQQKIPTPSPTSSKRSASKTPAPKHQHPHHNNTQKSSTKSRGRDFSFRLQRKRCNHSCNETQNSMLEKIQQFRLDPRSNKTWRVQCLLAHTFFRKQFKWHPKINQQKGTCFSWFAQTNPTMGAAGEEPSPKRPNFSKREPFEITRNHSGIFAVPCADFRLDQSPQARH